MSEFLDSVNPRGELRKSGVLTSKGEISFRPGVNEKLAGGISSGLDPRPQAEQLAIYAKQINEQFSCLPIPERISLVYSLVGDRSVITTTSGGIQSGVLLSQIYLATNLDPSSAVAAKIRAAPIILIDTGDMFAESFQYAADLQNLWELPITRFKHRLTRDELEYNVSIRTDLPRDEALDDLTKVRPMKEILNRFNSALWIAGNRRDQSKGRADLPFAHVENGVLKIFPLADVSRADVVRLASELRIPAHPLAGKYSSVGDKSTTVESAQGEGERSGRFSGSGREECGLHTRWAKRGSVFIANGDAYVEAESFPVEILPLENT